LSFEEYTSPMLDTGDSQFACALFDRLRTDGGNVCFSPLSVRTVFALCYLGARGRTADEMRRAFGFPTPTETREQFKMLLGDLAARGAHVGPPIPEWAQTSESPILRVASRLWGATGRPLLEEFVRAAAEDFGAPFEQLDFAREPEGSRARMNAWVDQVTEHKVVDLIARGQVGVATTLVAANAAYLRAAWMDTFPEKLTHPGPFFAPKRKVEVPMMQHTTHHAYGELHGTQVLELTYIRGELSMRLAVPADESGLARAESLTNELLALPLRHALVHLSMPRFRCESRFNLEGPLSEMGLASAFRHGHADLSGIDGTRDLYLSSVSHKAFVDVDENGTEAAAATVLTAYFGSASRPEPTIEVRIDRPFLFWIVDRPTSAVLFAGRIVDPANGP
jgi:serpin B